MSPSEIAFLALGLVLGAAIGAALAQVVRARPAPRREIRLTITPNAIPARRAATLSVPPSASHPGPLPGSPNADLPAGALGAALEASAAGTPSAPSPEGMPRTRVQSAPVVLPATAVAVPVRAASPDPAPVPVHHEAPVQGGPVRLPVHPPRSGSNTGSEASARPALGGAAIGGAAATSVAVAVMDASARPGVATTAMPVLAPVERPVLPDDGFTTLVRPRRPFETPRPTLAADAVPVAAPVARSTRLPVMRAAASTPPSAGAPGPAGTPGAAGAAGPAVDPCAGQRRAAEERCALADVAREQAKRAADALREAQRAYDTLRERVDRASDEADPRRVAATKEALHASFRAASDRAATSDETEAAARAWLTEINALNVAVREARRAVEAGTAELRSRLAALERLSAEADAARIAGENAEAWCREAREDLAGCEEADARSREAVRLTPPEPHPFDGVWPADSPDLPDASRPSPAELMAGLPAIVRVLRGDREARDLLAATLAAGDPEASRDWQLRVSRLADAIISRATEDGYLDLPDDHPFWRLFSHRECRDIVGALSALGFRYDGMGGFADGRTPATRDLSLAVGYAGLDRMRIRTWPSNAEIGALYERAVVAADDWLADQAGDLSLGRMVDALGNRAADLADLWNAWGRVRPALLAT